MEQFQTTWAPLLYLASGVLFILALRGLSSPATSRAGNRNGMIGMTIAVGTTIVLFWNALDATTWGILAAGALVGGGIGAVIALISLKSKSWEGQGEDHIEAVEPAEAPAKTVG